MSKASDNFYFNAFVEATDYSLKAAEMLHKTFSNYSTASLESKMEELHEIEHQGDDAKHRLMNELVKAFITPIEREDIIELSQNIDDVTDAIEDVLMRAYMCNVQSIRPEGIVFTELIVKCCTELKALMVEFKHFKRSKTIHDHIIELNRLEEEGDRLFLEGMRELHTACNNPIDIIAWREMLHYMEKCCDTCEHIADVVESVIFKNT